MSSLTVYPAVQKLEFRITFYYFYFIASDIVILRFYYHLPASVLPRDLLVFHHHTDNTF